jgi:hypothetical protein
MPPSPIRDSIRNWPTLRPTSASRRLASRRASGEPVEERLGLVVRVDQVLDLATQGRVVIGEARESGGAQCRLFCHRLVEDAPHSLPTVGVAHEPFLGGESSWLRL